MIEIRYYHYWSDWTTVEKQKIDETRIKGFQISYRAGCDWFIVVKVNPDYRHGVDWVLGVPFVEVVKILQNEDATIIGIDNMHHSDSFVKELNKVFKRIKEQTKCQ